MEKVEENDLFWSWNIIFYFVCDNIVINSRAYFWQSDVSSFICVISRVQMIIVTKNKFFIKYFRTFLSLADDLIIVAFSARLLVLIEILAASAGAINIALSLC
jgi:hypothetical protein